MPLEAFLWLSFVTIYNTQTATRQTVSLDELCALYNVFYVVVPRFEKADGVLKDRHRPRRPVQIPFVPKDLQGA